MQLRNQSITVNRANQNWSKRKQHANNVLNKLRTRMVGFYPDTFSGLLQGDANTFTSVLQKHRIESKFFEPTRSNEDALQRECYSGYYNFEEHHLKKYHERVKTIRQLSSVHTVLEGGLPPFNAEERQHLFKARSLIHDWLKQFSYNSNFLDLDFTPGESYISSGGLTSVRQKLGRIEHWTTYWHCLEDTCLLIYRHRALKKMAKVFINEKASKQDVHDLHTRFGGAPNKGYLIFRELLLRFVLTIVDGARGSSVPKNLSKVRFISVEATFPLLLQRSVSCFLLKALDCADNYIGEPGTDYKVGDGQLRHKRMIADSDYATIDQSNASDSILCGLVEFLFPPHWVKMLLRFRAYFVDVPGIGNVTPLKLSSMGCGFTFEILSLVMLAFARQFDETASAYGDDVVIRNDAAKQFISLCESVGFQINNSKTFVNSAFRESCGAFYHDSIGYITSYDFSWIKTPVDLIVTCNKLHSIAQAGYDHSAIFQKSYEQLLECVPASQKGPPPVDDYAYESNFDQYVYVKGYLRKHRESWTQNKQWSRYTEQVREILVGLGYHYINLKCEVNADISNDLLEDPVNHYYMHELCVIEVPRFIQRRVPDDKQVAEIASYFSYLHAGRRSDDYVRGKGKWVYKKFFVAPCGTLYPIAHLRLQRKLMTQHIRHVAASVFHDYESPYVDAISTHEDLLLQILGYHFSTELSLTEG